MKAKLIKNSEGYDTPYILTNMEDILIASTECKLSIKNCQAIERGYDFDEYTEAIAYASEFGYPSPEGFSDEQIGRLHGFIDGFQKAIKLMGDKKFSEEDIHEVYSLGEAEDRFGFHDFLQQNNQTEWDVEIVQEEGKDTFGNAELTWYNPKLDADGCLILKRAE